MQVKVPKFIDIQDRVVLGMTWRQFAALGGGLMGGTMAFMLLTTFLGISLALLSIGFGAAYAFAKVNGRPFQVFVVSMWNYVYKPRKYLWQREGRRVRPTKKASVTQEPTTSVEASPERLKAVAQMLDTHKNFER